MFCPNCGKKIPDQAKFCGYCGSPVTAPAEPQNPEPRKPARKKGKIAGIILAIAAILILVPLALFAVFRVQNASSEDVGGGKETLQESQEKQTEPEAAEEAPVLPSPEPADAAEDSSSSPPLSPALEEILPALAEEAPMASKEVSSVSVTWTRMNHSYREENPSGAFVNCYYDLASVPEDTETGRRINEALYSAYQEFLRDNEIGGEYSGGFDEGEINFENGMEGEVSQNADGLLSLKYHHNWNMGGVGDGSCSGITIDLQTGDRLYLSDIVPENGSPITFQQMEDIALNFVRGNGAEVDSILLDEFRAQTLDDLEFYIEDDQIILCIAKYQLGPGAMGAPEIPTGIYLHSHEGEAVEVSADTLPPSLSEFLQNFDFAYHTDGGTREYDCRHLDNIYSRLPKGIVGSPTYVHLSLYTDEAETSWDSESDPLGRHPAGYGYLTVPKSTVLFILENVFNVPESDAVAMLNAAMAEDPDFYEFEKDGKPFLCNKIGGVGGPGYDITYESVRYDGEKYYIVYDCTDAIPVGARTYVYYAEMALKETDGKEYWSIYYHSEHIPDAEGPAQTAPEVSANSPWLGLWTSTSGESLDIYDVSDTGLSLTFHKFSEIGNPMDVAYEMEFDNAEKTIASEIGGPDDHGGWEYTFVLGDGTITVQSRYPDQVFTREPS